MKLMLRSAQTQLLPHLSDEDRARTQWARSSYFHLYMLPSVISRH